MSEVIGFAHENITSGNVCCEESPLGDLIADAAREMLGADVAVVLSQDVTGYLMAGNLTEEDIANVVVSDHSYALLYLQEEEIEQVLEYGVSFLSLTERETIDFAASQTDFFPQVSGMRYRCDASAPEGERIMSLQLENQDEYLAVIPAHLLTEEQKEEVIGEYGIRTLFEQYIEQKETLTVPADGRIEIIGAYANPWISDGMFLMAILIAAMVSLIRIPHILTRKRDIEKREAVYLSGIFRAGNRKPTL